MVVLQIPLYQPWSGYHRTGLGPSVLLWGCFGPYRQPSVFLNFLQKIIPLVNSFLIYAIFLRQVATNRSEKWLNITLFWCLCQLPLPARSDLTAPSCSASGVCAPQFTVSPCCCKAQSTTATDLKCSYMAPMYLTFGFTCGLLVREP
jgi:hypothetical protein